MVAPLIPYAAGIVGSWIGANVIGLSDFLGNAVDPKIITPKNSTSYNTFVDYILGNYQFKYYILAPSNEDIKAIDDFFESYGYRVNKFDVPKLNVRDTFTFVKTKDAQVTSSVRQAAEQMTAMLNAGYKFWVTEIGE